MAKPPPVLPRDPYDLPFRIPLPVVLALCGYSRSTLGARIKAGMLPKHVDRGRAGNIWLRDEVLRALGLATAKPPAPSPEDAWTFKPDAYRDALEEIKAAQKLMRSRFRAGQASPN